MSNESQADTSALGDRRTEYGPERPKFVMIAGWGVLGFVFLGVSVLLSNNGLLNISPIICTDALFFGIGLYFTYEAIQSHRMRVQLYDKGFVDVRGSSKRIVRWEDIAEVYQSVTDHYSYGMKTQTTHKFIFRLVDGKKLTYTDTLKNVGFFGRHVNNEVTALKLPLALELLARGEPQTFGKMTIGRDGVSMGKYEVFWQDIESIFVNNALINVKPKSGNLGTGWPAQKVAETPNAFVLLNLLDSKVKIQN